MALAVLTVLVGVLAVVNQSPVSTPPLQAPTVTVATPAVTVVKLETPSAPQTPKAAPVVAPIQNCTPPAFGALSKINLTNTGGGYTELIDSPAYYRVYGDTAAQIKAQLRQCPAVPAVGGGDSFAAVTSGEITWQYTSNAGSNGLCTMNSVKVGLHTRMILPEWHATGAAASGLAAQWQRVVDGTTVHETEHVHMYQQYAKQLLSELVSMPATDCASVEASVKNKTAAVIAALDAAQAGVDHRTGHGVTQGAVLR